MFVILGSTSESQKWFKTNAHPCIQARDSDLEGLGYEMYNWIQDHFFKMVLEANSRLLEMLVYSFLF